MEIKQNNNLDILSDENIFKIYQLGIKWQLSLIHSSTEVNPENIIHNFGNYIRKHFNDKL